MLHTSLAYFRFTRIDNIEQPAESRRCFSGQEDVYEMVRAGSPDGLGPWTLGIFLGTGLFLTVKCRFFQFRGFFFWVGVPPWEACLKARIMTPVKNAEKSPAQPGNHQPVSVGVHCSGGHGRHGKHRRGSHRPYRRRARRSVLDVDISPDRHDNAYAETMLGIRYRYRDKDGHYICGPFIYMERGLGLRGMGVLYSFLCLMSSLGMGSMVQANSAISTMEYTWHVPALAGGLIFTGLLALVTWGGIRRIGNVAEKLVPAASGIYIAFSMIVILSCLEQIPGALASMVTSAFRPEAAAGGTAGYVISRSVRYGISRGVFSNEAGLGTLAVLHGPTEAQRLMNRGCGPCSRCSLTPWSCAP